MASPTAPSSARGTRSRTRRRCGRSCSTRCSRMSTPSGTTRCTSPGSTRPGARPARRLQGHRVRLRPGRRPRVGRPPRRSNGVRLFDAIVTYEFVDPEYGRVLSALHAARQGSRTELDSFAGGHGAGRSGAGRAVQLRPARSDAVRRPALPVDVDVAHEGARRAARRAWPRASPRIRSSRTPARPRSRRGLPRPACVAADGPGAEPADAAKLPAGSDAPAQRRPRPLHSARVGEGGAAARSAWQAGGRARRLTLDPEPRAGRRRPARPSAFLLGPDS